MAIIVIAGLVTVLALGVILWIAWRYMAERRIRAQKRRERLHRVLSTVADRERIANLRSELQNIKTWSETDTERLIRLDAETDIRMRTPHTTF